MFDTFDETIAEHFEDEEIDGRILLSPTVHTEEAMEKLGLQTIGKKGKFLAKIEELSGMVICLIVANFQFANLC